MRPSNCLNCCRGAGRLTSSAIFSCGITALPLQILRYICNIGRHRKAAIE